MGQNEQTPGELPWTGERLVTAVKGETAVEHLHRYSLACELARGKDVVDVASGEGYGSSLLAAVARRVIGVDICPDAVRHASNKYSRPNLAFKVGDCAAIPLPDASADLLVSFETLEHHDKHEEMMAEAKRVLRPAGVLILSTPNKRVYTDLPGTSNPFHVKELYRDEFEVLLGRHFKSHLLLGQLLCDGSVIKAMGDAVGDGVEVIEGDYQGADRTAWIDRLMYFVAIASDRSPLPVVPAGVYDGRRLWPTRQQYMAECAGQLQGIYAHLQAANAQQQATQAQLQAAQAQVQAAQAERVHQCDLRDRELAALRSSRSWRLAQAFSKMAGVARNWKRRVGALGKRSA